MDIRAHVAALIGMLVGSALTLGAVVGLNRLTGELDHEQGPREVSFEVTAPPPKPKPKPKRQQPRRQRKSTNKQRTALPPPPSLAANLSGVDLGLDPYQLESLGDVSDSVLGDTESVVHTESTVDRRPTPAVTTPIEVPASARAKNLSGRVVLSVLIGRDGKVRSVKVLQSDPPGVFDQAATRAVSSWVFEPATYKGQSVEVWATLPIQFQP